MLGWGGFWILTLIWGSLYLLSRIGLESIDPLHLAFIRTGIAAIGLNLIIAVRRLPIPRDIGTLLHLTASGIGGVMIPIVLLTWGLQTVESGVGSVLQATAAVFAAVVSHFFFKDERLSPIKFMGVIISFVGVVVLTQRNIGISSQNSIEGQIAIILAALLYAISTIHSRVLIQRNVKPLVLSGISIMAATLGMVVMIVVQTVAGNLAPIVPFDITPQVLLVILTLGFVQSFIAYLLYYDVVANIGAAQATMVTYTIPPVALILGILFADEQLDLYIVVGTILIFTGIGFTKVNTSKQIQMISHYLRFSR